MKDKILDIINNCDLLDSECAEIISQIICDELTFVYFTLTEISESAIITLLRTEKGFTQAEIENSINKLK